MHYIPGHACAWTDPGLYHFSSLGTHGASMSDLPTCSGLPSRSTQAKFKGGGASGHPNTPPSRSAQAYLHRFQISSSSILNDILHLQGLWPCAISTTSSPAVKAHHQLICALVMVLEIWLRFFMLHNSLRQNRIVCGTIQNFSQSNSRHQVKYSMHEMSDGSASYTTRFHIKDRGKSSPATGKAFSALMNPSLNFAVCWASQICIWDISSFPCQT